MKKYQYAVFIGRFSPFHNAHLEIVKKALSIAENLIIVVGSAEQPRTYKNPWTFEERRRMILNTCQELNLPTENIFVEPNVDSVYNDPAWAVRVQNIVQKYTGINKKEIAIIGYRKDDTSFYLDFFPQWKLETVPLIEALNATDVRQLYFRSSANMNFIRGVVPSAVFDYLNMWKSSEEYQYVLEEKQFNDEYQSGYAGLKHPPYFVTCDAVVIQSGHVLMVRRRSRPGKGLWALPGGFLNATSDRSVVDGILRELREETGIKVPEPVLRGCIKQVRVFDAIDRSARGRTITHAAHIVLPDGALPRVKGMDDADKAKWIPISEVRSDQCFEDHYSIIQTFLGN